MSHPGQNTIEDMRFQDFHQRHWKEIDNHADGNCLFEAVLDSANHYLQVDHDLNRLFQGPGGKRRDLAHAQNMRKHLLNFNKLCLQNRDQCPEAEIASLEQSNKRLKAKKGIQKWGTTCEIDRIAHQYNIAIIIYTGPDEIWTSSLPRFDPERDEGLSDLNNYIVIANQGQKQSHHSAGVGGTHFVALVPTTSQGASSSASFPSLSSSGKAKLDQTPKGSKRSKIDQTPSSSKKQKIEKKEVLVVCSNDDASKSLRHHNQGFLNQYKHIIGEDYNYYWNVTFLSPKLKPSQTHIKGYFPQDAPKTKFHLIWFCGCDSIFDITTNTPIVVVSEILQRLHENGRVIFTDMRETFSHKDNIEFSGGIVFPIEAFVSSTKREYEEWKSQLENEPDDETLNEFASYTLRLYEETQKLANQFVKYFTFDKNIGLYYKK